MAKQNKTVRIHNTVTNTYYRIRQRSTSAGQKGTIIGKWKGKKMIPKPIPKPKNRDIKKWTKEERLAKYEELKSILEE